MAEGDVGAFRTIYLDAAEQELADALAARVDGLGWWLAFEDGHAVAAIELHAAGEGISGIAADEAEIGWVVVDRARGRGIATEAAAAVARHALEVVGVPWLVAYVRPSNAASLRVVAKLGMAYEGDGLTRSGDPMRVFRLRRSRR